MKRVIGFALFFLMLGILLSMILPNAFAEILVMIVCLLLSYNLFCC